jgi:hypothetical protein
MTKRLPKSRPRKSDKSSSQKKSKEGSSKKETKYCKIHGHCAHSTEDCRSKNKRYKSDKSDSKNGNKSHNKTWKRNAGKETLVNKKELAVLIKKAVKKEVSTKESKKRKSSDNEEGFLVECLSKPLDGFNYKDMENLNIDDDDSSIDSEVSC